VGHSVLELLVVISIIVILLAMSAPVYIRAIKQARQVASGQR
jgi:type II secretory pathway pseudopilin PulG